MSVTETTNVTRSKSQNESRVVRFVPLSLIGDLKPSPTAEETTGSVSLDPVGRLFYKRTIASVAGHRDRHWSEYDADVHFFAAKWKTDNRISKSSRRITQGKKLLSPHLNDQIESMPWVKGRASGPADISNFVESCRWKGRLLRRSELLFRLLNHSIRI